MNNKYCQNCNQRLDYCKCPTVKTDSPHLCNWPGCESLGVVSLSTNGGGSYCREHSKKGVGIDYSLAKGVSPAVAMGFPPGYVLVDRALIKTDKDVMIVQHLQSLAGKGVCTRLAENGGKRNGMEGAL